MDRLKVWIFSLLLSMVAIICFTSCSDDNDDNMGKIETITMASNLYKWPYGSNNLFPTYYLIKREGKQEWEHFYSGINGFTFEEGYETVLEVRIDPIAKPAADQGNEQFTLIKVISKIQKESEGLPEGTIKYYD